MPSILIPIKSLADNPAIDIVLDTFEKNKQIIVFVSSKSSAEKTADLKNVSKENKENIFKKSYLLNIHGSENSTC